MALITFTHRPSLRLPDRSSAARRAGDIWRRLADAPLTANPVTQALGTRGGHRTLPENHRGHSH